MTAPILIGLRIECTVCERTKCPRGRSAPLTSSYCDWECPGWSLEPHVGSLWPGETSAEFGFPVGSVGTREATDAERQCGSDDES